MRVFYLLLALAAPPPRLCWWAPTASAISPARPTRPGARICRPTGCLTWVITPDRASRAGYACQRAQPLALLQDHHASVSVLPVGRHALTAAAAYCASQGPAAPVRAVFAGLTCRYTLPTARKIDLAVRWNNIFDTRQY